MTSAAIANTILDASECAMEDYIIVQQPDERRDDLSMGSSCSDDDDDDDSYDYCDDIYCQQEDVDNDDDQSITMSICSNSDEPREHVTLTVPSVLMKDLDEAHAAASLTKFSEMTASEMHEKEMDDPVDEEQREDKPPPVPEPPPVKSITVIQLEPGKDVLTVKKEVSMPSHRAVAFTAPSTTLSRASNRKRRKKLKLTKKTRAAAHAAQTMSLRTIPSGTNAKAKNDSKKTTTTPARGASKKVANFSVVCARETMATYRHEVFLTTMST